MLARLDANNDLDEEKLNYLQDIPDEYKLLKEFLSQAYISYDLPKPLRHTLINIGKNINMIDVEAIQKEFIKTSEGKQHIAIFLYEGFLQEYDKLKETQNRKESGVYYTPVEATNFITRGVKELIKTRFNMPRGYLAEQVKVLDFACGTGTFLHSVFEEMLKDNKDDLDRETIKNKIVKDIYGHEILFVPYIILHTMLTNFLKGHGIIFKEKERLGIYLANTLDIS
jgi:predicted helicase